MEPFGLRARRHAELVCEPRSRFRVRGERGRRASRRCMRPHEHPEHVLVVWMLDEHGLRLGDDGCPVTGRERRFDLDPAGRRDPRLAPLARHVRPLGILVGEQRTADQRERGVGSGTGDREPAVGLCVGRLLDAAIDLVDVEPDSLERVSPGTVDQVLGTEHASQPRHEHTTCSAGLAGSSSPHSTSAARSTGTTSPPRRRAT